MHAAVPALMEHFSAAIDPAALASIQMPVGLIWGRHDRGTPLAVAEAASSRFGWPLRVIEDSGDDPPVEQPAAFVSALRGLLQLHQRGEPR